MGNRHSHTHTVEYRTDPAVLAQIKKQRKESYMKQKELLQAQVDDNTAQYTKVHQELLDIQLQITQEEKLVTDFHDEYNDPNAKIIVLVGNTGDGKSTVGNRLCGDTSMMADTGPFETSDQGRSCTQQLSKQKTQIGNIKITVVDAPGWNDSEGKDRVHANDLCAYLYGCGGINNFILVRNASNYRFDDNFKLMLQRYENMFGKSFWNYLIVILTRVEKGFPEQQFNQARKDEDIRNHIYDSFNLNSDECVIPVIPIGLDNYTDAIQTFMGSLCDDKFECAEIKSPLQELQAKEKEILKTDQKFQHKINELNKQINDIQKALDSL